MECREISSRCAVWAEPSIVDSARYEFEDTEKMLAAAEELLGKYVWGRYLSFLLNKQTNLATTWWCFHQLSHTAEWKTHV